MARSLAGDYIQQLFQRGETASSIGRKLGYDQAIIGRVAKGQRPGSNLVGPLRSLLAGTPSAQVPKAMHQKHIMRDEQGRIISYNAKKPSARRLQQVLRQAQKQGANRAGIVADVGKFKGYEQRGAGQHLVRAFRKGEGGSPGGLAQRLATSSQSGEDFVLGEIKATTGAEEAADLRSVTLNFYYG